MTNEPRVRIDYSARFKRDLKQLYKKYRSIRDDLQPLIDSISSCLIKKSLGVLGVLAVESGFAFLQNLCVSAV